MVVCKKDDVQLGEGEGVLKDPNHESKQIAGNDTNKANDKDKRIFFMIINDQSCGLCVIMVCHFKSKPN